MSRPLARFNPNGALSPAEPAYVVRDFERQVFEHLSASRWVSLLGPRQYGKSSALMRIQSQLKEGGYHCAFIDLQSHANDEDGYAQFLEWFAASLAEEIGADFARPARRERAQLDPWMRAILTQEFRNVAVLIDEASGVPAPFRRSFFAQLRAIYNSRGRTYSAKGRLASRVVFAFAGTFRATRMIDDANSPFNVSEEVIPDDLTRSEVAELAALGLSDQAGEYAQRAWDETSGQPYYVQYLLAAVQRCDHRSARSAAFQHALEDLRRGVHGHLENLTTLVDKDDELRRLVPRILNGKERFDGSSPAQNYAIVTGVARNSGGLLVPRNPIYAAALRRFLDEELP